jgi:HEAT repeat protein
MVLEKTGKPAVPALIEALGDGDEEVRWAACRALGNIRDASAVPALIEALGDEDWAVRREACWALGEIGEASAVPALIEALEDGEQAVRRAARDALVQIGEPAVPYLKKAMESAPPDIREQVPRVLVRIEQRKR